MLVSRNNKSGKISWAITEDHLDEEKVSSEKLEKIKADCPHEFQLFDDNDILYYTGYSDDSLSFKPLDWAMDDSGCTDIKYKNPTTGIFETL